MKQLNYVLQAAIRDRNQAWIHFLCAIPYNNFFDQAWYEIRNAIFRETNKKN